MRIPRWYHLLMASTVYLISTLMIVVGAIIALCLIADWIWHLGWGYPWWAAVFIVFFILMAFAINRGAVARISSIRKSTRLPPVS